MPAFNDKAMPNIDELRAIASSTYPRMARCCMRFGIAELVGLLLRHRDRDPLSTAWTR